MTTTTKTYPCFCCNHEPFESILDLAKHIRDAKHGHQKSKMFAAKVLAGSTIKAKIELKHSDKDPDYEPTEFGEENRENRRVQLSGEQIYVNCYCPKCRQSHRFLLPVEFTELRFLWKIQNKPAIFCENCRR
jgi:hypothetical protein